MIIRNRDFSTLNPATTALPNIILGGCISAVVGLVAAFISHLLASKRQDKQLESANQNLRLQLAANREIQESTWERTSELERNKQLYADRREIYVEILTTSRQLLNNFDSLDRKTLSELSGNLAHQKEVAFLYAEPEVVKTLNRLIEDATRLCSFGISTILISNETDKTVSTIDTLNRLTGNEHEVTEERYTEYTENLRRSSDKFYHAIRRELRISS